MFTKTERRESSSGGAVSVAAGTSYGVEASHQELAALRASARGIDLGHPSRVKSAVAGPYLSPYRGRGMEFAEVRAYVPGDDARHIDWRVTARTGQPHSKLFEEERERPLIVLADARTPMRFGTRTCFKSVAAARWSALLVWKAAECGDRVGGVTLSDSRIRSFRPRRSRNGATALIMGLADATSAPCGGGEGSLADALMELRRIACVGSQVFILSDFADLDDVARRHLRQLARYTETSCVLVHDPLESAPPPPGHYRVSNGRGVIAIGTASKANREVWPSHFEERRLQIARLCREARAGFGLLSTDHAPLASAEGRTPALPISADPAARAPGGLQ
jgi:uncharacterized protein (DUF58 family)